MECQKKAICEIYQDESNELGEFGRRAKHSLDFVDSVQYLNVPDEVLNLADEYAVRKTFCSKILYRYYFCMLNNRKLHWFIFLHKLWRRNKIISLSNHNLIIFSLPILTSFGVL